MTHDGQETQAPAMAGLARHSTPKGVSEMTDQRRIEELKAGSEARASSGSRSLASWDAFQTALRRYLSVESYRREREDSQSDTGAGDGTPHDAPKPRS